MEEKKSQTTYKKALKERILDTAMVAFSQKGVKAVKMDDIAQALSISKRTLYELYDNKELLLFEGVAKYKAIKEREVQQILAESPNVMDMVLKLYRQKIMELKMTSPLFYADIERYPRVVEFLQKDKEVSHKLFLEFLQRGVKENYFSKDLDYELISQIFSVLTNYVFTSQLYTKHSLRHIFYNMVFVTLRGICTQKGIEILDRSLSSESE
ncbi:MAG: TetR/AcrR family transcriptional regulator [Prevotella sp.]|nr:TetR/AcrR family transcriptional regulator [Prevotella sp.]